VPVPLPAGASGASLGAGALEGGTVAERWAGIFNYALNLDWNGTGWTAEPYHETGFLNGVSCASAVFCAAVGDLEDSAERGPDDP